jgi:ATP-dependent Lon protease
MNYILGSNAVRERDATWLKRKPSTRSCITAEKQRAVSLPAHAAGGGQAQFGGRGGSRPGNEEKEILVVAQRDPNADVPKQGDLYGVGTRAAIRKVNRTEHALEVLVVGLERVSVLGIIETEPYLRARVQSMPMPEDTGPECRGLQREVLQLASQAITIAQPQASRKSAGCSRVEDPIKLVYFLASLLSLDLAKEQSLLEAQTARDALRLMHAYLRYEVQVLELRSKIAGDVQNEMGKEQREYFLRQQLRAIQQELGERSPEQARGRHAS